MPRKLLIVFACAVLGLSSCRASQKMSYSDLAHQLIDLERVARLPAEGEECSQWSSYDRRSTYDAEEARYVNWDANSDGNGYIRREGDEYVLAEMDGPGVIWRIWSATAEAGLTLTYRTRAVAFCMRYRSHASSPET